MFHAREYSFSWPCKDEHGHQWPRHPAKLGAGPRVDLEIFECLRCRALAIHVFRRGRRGGNALPVGWRFVRADWLPKIQAVMPDYQRRAWRSWIWRYAWDENSQTYRNLRKAAERLRWHIPYPAQDELLRRCDRIALWAPICGSPFDLLREAEQFLRDIQILELPKGKVRKLQDAVEEYEKTLRPFWEYEGGEP